MKVYLLKPPVIEDYDLYLVTIGTLGNNEKAFNNVKEFNKITKVNYICLIPWLMIANSERINKNLTYGFSAQ